MQTGCLQQKEMWSVVVVSLIFDPCHIPYKSGGKKKQFWGSGSITTGRLGVLLALLAGKKVEMEERGECGRVSNSLQPKSPRTNQSLEDIWEEAGWMRGAALHTFVSTTQTLEEADALTHVGIFSTTEPLSRKLFFSRHGSLVSRFFVETRRWLHWREPH